MKKVKPKRKMKKGGGSRKGSAFERQICIELSEWFSEGKRTDLFWRNLGSGARSTVKSKKGISIANSAGDIGYLDVAGKPLTDKITFELKAGYSKAETTSLVDSLAHQKSPQLAQFIEQAINSSKQANTPYWAVIQKRNQKKVLIHVPLHFILDVRKSTSSLPVWAVTPSQETTYKDKLGDYVFVHTMPFELFCKNMPVSFFHDNPK
ncbi:MAG: hypothetical protein LBP59_11195 [Planctomycetaceae bacterium]|jgi:hypothetical protein|nr:hypothetical protein [Planctomycetaceae bacterium]